MSKFGIINFEKKEQEIEPEPKKFRAFLFSKFKQEREIGIRYMPLNYKEGEGFCITIEEDFSCINEEDWGNIEETLINQNILHIAKPNNVPNLPFERIEIYNGYRMNALLCGHLWGYINKYRLIHKKGVYAQVGIIDGDINATLNAVGTLMDKVLNLTIFTSTPEAYKDTVVRVYQAEKIYIKLMYPNARAISEMDIVFDLSANPEYIRFSKATAIFICLVPPRYKPKPKELSPRIWYSFDIIWQKDIVSTQLFEAILMAEGYTKGILRRKMDTFDIKIREVNTKYELTSLVE
ncbi:MAG: hypothetical protein ATN36_03090 [Epulopiscium sp. Nele67-Bin005]|nr:MAG: hypothetical protein ATN36_03090 [Epulopiscium sp. Nele67-Bin005]